MGSHYDEYHSALAVPEPRRQPREKQDLPAVKAADGSTSHGVGTSCYLRTGAGLSEGKSRRWQSGPADRPRALSPGCGPRKARGRAECANARAASVPSLRPKHRSTPKMRQPRWSRSSSFFSTPSLRARHWVRHEPPQKSIRNPARYCCTARLTRQAVHQVLDRERKMANLATTLEWPPQTHLRVSRPLSRTTVPRSTRWSSARALYLS